MTILLGLDQGTSGTKAYLMDEDGRRVGFGYQALRRLPTRPEWAELDPQAVAASAESAIRQALVEAGCRPQDIRAVGIASQRDTDFIWDGRSGEPLASAITWQDLRTVPMVEALSGWEHAGELRRRLGYYPGPWCAAMHLSWRRQHQPVFRKAVAGGYARIGMAAAWLLAALGTPNGHLHDYSLIQKTGLWDLRRGGYWPEWMAHLGLTSAGLPQAAPSVHPYGVLRCSDGDSQAEVPVLAMIGDQQAALFGHGCTRPGQAECTHGTASFVNVVAGAAPPEMDSLNVYYAWSLPQGEAGGAFGHTYCLEADTTTSGAAVRWMQDRGHIVVNEAEIDALAASVPDGGGVMFVPAFTGLNVPYNDYRARAAIFGLSLNHDRSHIARAFLESLGYQLRAILETIQSQTGLHITQLSVGGGLSQSNIACQIQADLLGIPLVRPLESETTARGAALLAGIGAGLWSGPQDLPPLPAGGVTFEPALAAGARDEGYARWQRAVEWVRAWGAA
jgi:glycerol kinase